MRCALSLVTPSRNAEAGETHIGALDRWGWYERIGPGDENRFAVRIAPPRAYTIGLGETVSVLTSKWMTSRWLCSAKCNRGATARRGVC